MGRFIWPAFEAVAGRFANVGSLLDRLHRERTDHWCEQAAIGAAVQAKADAWLADASYRDIALVQDYATSDAYSVVELLVLAALDSDPRLTANLADSVEIFAKRVIENMQALEGELDARVVPNAPHIEPGSKPLRQRMPLA